MKSSVYVHALAEPGITTESWLNAKARPAQRGRVFSTYMVGTFVALALGQLLIGGADVEGAAPFNAIVALFAVALAMVSATRAEPPRIAASAHLPYRHLSRSAPVAVAGSALSGLVSGAFYSLVPAWLQGQGADQATIAVFMLAAVLGGLAFQIPVGRLSDRFDRRVVLAALGLGFSGTAAAMVLLPRSPPVVLPAAAVLGGFMSTLYPICVAHAHDRMPSDRVVAVSGRLILVSGLGSVLGPLVGAMIMARFDIDGVFYFMAGATLLLALLSSARSVMTAAPPHLERPFGILARRRRRSRTTRWNRRSDPSSAPALPGPIPSGADPGARTVRSGRRARTAPTCRAQRRQHEGHSPILAPPPDRGRGAPPPRCAPQRVGGRGGGQGEDARRSASAPTGRTRRARR